MMNNTIYIQTTSGIIDAIENWIVSTESNVEPRGIYDPLWKCYKKTRRIKFKNKTAFVAYHTPQNKISYYFDFNEVWMKNPKIMRRAKNDIEFKNDDYHVILHDSEYIPETILVSDLSQTLWGVLESYGGSDGLRLIELQSVLIKQYKEMIEKYGNEKERVLDIAEDMCFEMIKTIRDKIQEVNE